MSSYLIQTKFLLCLSVFVAMITFQGLSYVARVNNSISMYNIAMQTHVMVTALSKSSIENTKDIPLTHPSNYTNRFPKYGTARFVEQCDWTMQVPDQSPKCKFLYTADPNSNEGISEWLAELVSAYIFSRQAKCYFLVRYTENITLESVLGIHPDLSSDLVDKLRNWTVPVQFNCTDDEQCYEVRDHFIRKGSTRLFNSTGTTIEEPLLAVPHYRTAYVQGNSVYYLYRKVFQPLESLLPNFQLETGMACSMETLFRPSPQLELFQPDLYTRILPAMHGEDTLVIGVYLRTAATDLKAKRSTLKQQQLIEEQRLKVANQTAHTVISLEKRYLAGNGPEPREREYSRIVWMFASDAQHVKNWVVNNFDTQNRSDASLKREILVSGADGTHTKSNTNPSTEVFAGAFVDWYLLGESDFVVSMCMGFCTFGETAALRTARPLYKGPLEDVAQMVH